METLECGGRAYPLNSKRLKLKYLQHLANAFDLPITATWSDLEVMINGKLVETNRDTTSIQVVIVQSEEGEQMLLKDVSGTFLVTPPLPILASKSPTPGQEDDDYEEWAESLTADMNQLHSMIQILEEERVALCSELQSTKEEVIQLKAELNKANSRLVELWQENCEQLLEYDNAMADKDSEVQLLREQLQVRELELARLKLAGLKEAAIPITTISKATKVSRVLSQALAVGDQVAEHEILSKTTEHASGSLLASSRGGIPPGFVKEDSQEVFAPRSGSYLSTTKVTTFQVPPGQRGHVSTTTTTTTTTAITTVNLSTSEHVATSLTANPFQEGRKTTESTRLLTTTVPLVTSTITRRSRVHLDQ